MPRATRKRDLNLTLPFDVPSDVNPLSGARRKPGMIRIKNARDSILGKQIICAECKTLTPRTGTKQIYCEPCSNERTRLRQLKWARDNPPTAAYVNRREKTNRSKCKARGIQNSVWDRWSLGDVFPDETGMVWVRRLAIPFTYAFSKNHAAAMNGDGHVFLRKETRTARHSASFDVAQAVNGIQPVENKVWIDLLIEKPDHRGDAINVLDHLVDAIKHGIGIDDRWFSIKRIDWRITKVAPLIYIGLGQEHTWNGRVCCYCGRTMPFENFYKQSSMKHGIGRECRDCKTSGARKKR